MNRVAGCGYVRDVAIVSAVMNALTMLFVALFAFSLWSGGELGWSTQPPMG